MSLIDKDGRVITFHGAGMVFAASPLPAPALAPVAEWPEGGSPRVTNLPPNGLLFYAGRFYQVNAQGYVPWSSEWPNQITVLAASDPTGLLGREHVLVRPTAPGTGMDWSQPLTAADVEIVGLEEDPVHEGRVTAIFEIVNESHPAIDAIALYWSDTGTPQAIGHPMAALGTDHDIPARGPGQPAVPATGRPRFRMRSSWTDSSLWHVRWPGETKDAITLRYQLTGPNDLAEGNVTYPEELFVGTSYPQQPPMTEAFQAEWASPWADNRWSFTVPTNFFVADGSEPLTIADLFPGDGLWHDLSDHDTVYVDTSGTIGAGPAMTGGVGVQRINDKSGNGHDLVAQSGATANYLADSDESHPYIRNSGFRWEPTAALGILRNVDAATAMVVAAPDGANDDAIIFFSVSNSLGGMFDLRYIDGKPAIRARRASDGSVNHLTWPAAVAEPAVIEAVVDYVGGTMKLSVNGADPVEANLAGSGWTEDAHSQKVSYFGSASAGDPFTGRFYAGVMVPRMLSNAEMEGVRTELAAKIGVEVGPGIPGRDDSDPGEPGVPAEPGTPPPDAEPDVTVSSISQLTSAIGNGAPGSVIALAPGNYSDFINIQGGLKKDPPIRIRPQDRANPPVFTSKALDLRSIQGLIFDGLRFESTATDDFGFPSGWCMHIHRSKRISFVNCTWIGYHATLASSFMEDFSFEWCRFEGTGMDYLRVYETCKNFTLRHCFFGNPNIDRSRAHQSNRHPDILQLATNAVNNGQGMDGMLVENNVIYGGPIQQGIFMFSERAGGGDFNHVHRNLTVRNNYIESQQIHGICIGGTDGFVVENNLLRRHPDSNGSQSETPYITFLTGHNKNGIVRNNVTPRQIGEPSWTGDTSGTTFTNNVVSTSAVPDGWEMPIVGPYNQPE